MNSMARERESCQVHIFVFFPDKLFALFHFKAKIIIDLKPIELYCQVLCFVIKAVFIGQSKRKAEKK